MKAEPGSFAPRRDLLIGLSATAPDFYAGDPVLFHLWVVNPNDVQSHFATCSDLDLFKLWFIDVYDGSGLRVLRKVEPPQDAVSTARIPPPGTIDCARNMSLKIEPHACLSGNVHDFIADLSTIYDFPPGSYDVRIVRTLEVTYTGGYSYAVQKTYEPTNWGLKFTIRSHPDRKSQEK